MSAQQKDGPATLPTRVEQACKDISAFRRQTDRGTVLTLVLGVAVLGALSFYFWYGHREFDDFTQPTKLTNAALEIIESNVPDARKQVEVEITKSAPTWAKALSRQALDSAPQARKLLVDWVSNSAEEALGKAQIISQDEMRRFLRDN